MCNNCREEIINIQTGEKLDWCKVNSLPDNAMLKVKPSLFTELDLKMNEMNNLNIWNATKGSDKIYWWYCPNCKESYDMNSYQRVKLNCKCPYCRGLRVNNSNSLASIRPDIASQWHHTLNGDKYPNEYTCGSGESFWWLGDCGHEWKCPINDRTSGSNCPYCNPNNPKVLKGFNDLSTTNPELANLLANKEDGYKYTQSSSKKVDWKCSCCGNIIKNKKISDINKKGIKCEYCRDGISFPEKVMINVLKDLGVYFQYDKSFSWSNKRRYDFYIPIDENIGSDDKSFNKSILIETHGKQHYEESTGMFKKERTLEEEISNDEYKKEIALINGIDVYITIDCKDSSIEYIKNSILTSELSKIFNFSHINWEEINMKSLKSKIVEICDIYKNSNKTSADISNEEGLSTSTVLKYLKIGNKLGLCDFTPHSNKTKQIIKERTAKKVVQLDLNGELIKEFSSISDVGLYLNKKDYSAISACCKGKLKSAFGFMWMYKDEYECMVLNNNKPSEYKRDDTIEVFQLNKNGEFINYFKTISEASKETGVDISNISNCCKGIYSQAGGFVWMFKEIYDDYIENGIEFNFIINEKTRKIVQLSISNEFIKEWNSITEATTSIDVKTVSSIQSCLLGKADTAGGYRWMYLEEYNDCLQGKKKFKLPKQKFEIVQLTLDFEFVAKYEDLNEPVKKYNIQKPNIVKVCKGERQSCGGFKWMYKTDYDKFLEQNNTGIS